MIPKKYDKKKKFSLDKLCEAASSQLLNEDHQKTLEKQNNTIGSKYPNEENQSIPTEFKNFPDDVERGLAIDTKNPISSNFPKELFMNYANPVEQETFDKNTLVCPPQLTQNLLQQLSSQLSPNSSTFTLNSSISSTLSNSLGKLNENKLVDNKAEQNLKYECHFCGKFCSKPSILQKHLRTHTNERPYSCSECSMKFKTKSNLSKHYKSKTHQIQTESNKHIDVEHDENYATVCSNNTFNRNENSKQQSFQESQSPSNMPNPYSSLDKILSSPLTSQNNVSKSNLDIKTQSQVLAPPYMPVAFKLIPNNTPYSFILQPPIMTETHSNSTCSLKSEQMLLNSSSENFAALYNLNSKQKDFYLNDSQKASKINKLKQNSEKNEQKEKKIGFNSKDISERISEIISKNNSIILDMPKIDKPRSKKVVRAYSDNKPTPKIDTVLRASSLTPTQSSETSIPSDPRQLINNSFLFNTSNSTDGDDFKQSIVTQTQQTNKNVSDSQNHPNLYLLVSNPNHLISINSNLLVSHSSTHTTSKLIQPLNVTSNSSTPSINDYGSLQSSPINVSTHMNQQNLLLKSKSFCDLFNLFNADEVPNVLQKHVLVKSQSESQNPTLIHQFDFRDMNENLKLSSIQAIGEGQMNNNNSFGPNNIYHQTSQNHIFKKQGDSLLSDRQMVVSKDQNDNQDKNVLLSSLNKLLLKSDKNKCHELKNYNKSLASMSAAPSTLTPNLTFNNPSSVGFLISQSFCTSSNELKNILLNSSEISHSNENNSFIKSDTTSLTTSSIKRAGRPKGSKNKKQSGLSKNNNQSIPAIKISYADNCFKEIDSKIELKKHILMKRSLSNENENKIGNGGRNSSLDLNETSEKSSFVNISKNKNNIIFDAKLKAMKNVCSNGFGNVSQEKLRYQQSSFSTCSGDSGSFLKQTLSTTCDLGVEESCNQNIKSQEHDLMNVFSGNVLNTVKNPNLHATSVFNHTKSSLPTTKLFRTPTTFSINDENPNRTLDQLKNLTDANNKKLNSKPINLLETQNFNDNTFEMEKKLQSERKYQLSIPIKKRRKTLTELGRGTTFGTTVDDNIDALNKTSSMLNKTKPLWRSAGSPNKQFIECAAVEGSEQSINSIENNVTERNDKLKVKNSSEFNRTCESFSDGNTTSNITNSINNISNHKCGIIEDNSLKRKIIDSLNLKNDGSSVGTSLNSLSTLTKNAAFNSDDSNKNTISNLVTYLHTNTNETQEISELQKNYCISTSFELKALPKGIDSSSNYSVPMSLSDDTEAAASLLDLSKSLHVLTQSDQGFCRQALIDSIQTSNSLTKTFSSRLPSSFSSSSVLSSLIQQQSTSFNNLLSSILTPVTSPAALTAQSTLNSSNHGVATGTNNGAYNTVPSLLASTISTNNYFMHKESYQCQICNEAFNKVSSLRTHTLLHSLDKPYKCVKCSVSFNNRWQFNRHNKSKHHFYASFFDSRPFKCIPCRKAFRIKGHLSKHKRSNQHKISKKNYDEMIAVKNQGPLDDVNEDKNHKRDVRVIDNLHDKPYTKGEYSSFKYSFKNTIKEKNQNAHENSQNIYSNVVINSQTTETFARSKETNTLGDILISGQKLIRNLNEADRQDGFISLNDDNDKNSSTSNMTSQTNHKINAKETNKDGYIGKKSKIKKIFKKSFDQSVDDKTYRKGRLTHQHSIDFDDIVGHDDNLSSLTKDAGVKRINGSVDDSKFISRKKLKINNGFLFKTHPAVKDGFPIDVEARVSLIGALRQTFKTCTMNDKLEGFKISTSSSAPNLISLDSANNISIEFTDTGSKGIFTTDTGVLYSHVNSGFHANTQQKLLQTLLQSSSKQDHTNNPLIPSQHKDYSSFTSASSTHDNASLNSTLEKPLSNASMKAGSNFVVVSLQESFTQQALQPDSVIKCRWCHLICASLNALMDHIEEHIERKVHECSVCKGGFENKQSLFNHQHLHNLQQHSQAINGFVKEINAIDDRGNNGVVNESTTTNDEDTENNFDGELKIDTGSSENDCDGEESTITESECSEEKSKITIGNIQSIISGCILNEETHDTNVNIV